MKNCVSSQVRAWLSGMLFFLIIIADRVTKSAAIAFLKGVADLVSGPTECIACTAGAPCCLPMGAAESVSGPCLSFDLVFNRGVTWGLFSPEGSLGFALVGILIGAITALLAYYAYTRWHAGYSIWGELLIVAGSVGNLIDRVLYHGVVDFIRLSWAHATWPIFNIADCCIVLGVFLVVIQKIRSE